MAKLESIRVLGAREHNLKDISVEIPRNKLVVFTGLSGSGKSSLAFDTIHAEGQRRYLETFSSYARQFIGDLKRPDVEQIEGLSPVIAIEQKTVSRNPRSTVGTITEVYDFLRLLYARIAVAVSPATGKPLVKYTEAKIIEHIQDHFSGQQVQVLAPLVRARKGHYRDLFERLAKQGYMKVRTDGEIRDIEKGMRLDRYKVHDIELVVDRFKLEKDKAKRLENAVRLALKQGEGEVIILGDNESEQRLSRNLMCPESGISLPEPEPNLFSFNSPYGACPKCNGLGKVAQTDLEKVIPDPSKSIRKGGLAPLGKYKKNWIFGVIETLLEDEGYDLNTPINKLEEPIIDNILYGGGIPGKHSAKDFEGVVGFLERNYEENPTKATKRWIDSFMNKVTCPACDGGRLKETAKYYQLDNTSIIELNKLSIAQLKEWIDTLPNKLNDFQRKIGSEIIKEVQDRLGFLLDVGLEYLSLDRSAATLSGGEAQRIRLATQIGSELTNVLYILDEPSIGLHQRDNSRLIGSLKKLRDTGNSVVVVEHDREMIEQADHVFDIGPGAGIDGGHIVAHGIPVDFMDQPSLTSDYLSRRKDLKIPARRKGKKEEIVLKGASGHNLKNVTLTLPLGKLVCVTGVSGSGKSSLINQTLFPAAYTEIMGGFREALPHKSLSGLKYIDKVISIDQTPIGRTPRSNPATYTSVFTDIRTLFTQHPEAQIRGYKPGRFSFNVKGGRCETCKGAGLRTIEMNFLPDVYVECDTCRGKRYNRETLQVRFKGKSISDVLDMTVEQALEFFENVPSIRNKVQTLFDVGLGYIRLGQSSTTLSGGEAQRVKLATELARKDTGQTLYIMDEPTTGLHFEDVRVLMDVIQLLVDKGNTVVIIEHNLDVIKVADHIIDIGPEGGEKGGAILFEGTPEELAKTNKGFTSRFLAEELKLSK